MMSGDLAFTEFPGIRLPSQSDSSLDILHIIELLTFHFQEL